MSLLIRQAVESDLDRIGEITMRAWFSATVLQQLEELYGLLAGKPWQERKRDSVVSSIGNNLDRCVVAEIDGVVVGYATWKIDAREKSGEVGNNAVDPDHRGHGIGTALIERTLDIMSEQGLTFLRVSTLVHDAPARRVYEKLGFKELNRSVTYTMSVEEYKDRNPSQ